MRRRHIMVAAIVLALAASAAWPKIDLSAPKHVPKEFGRLVTRDAGVYVFEADDGTIREVTFGSFSEKAHVELMILRD